MSAPDWITETALPATVTEPVRPAPALSGAETDIDPLPVPLAGVIVSQAGHVLTSRDDGATFKQAQLERPVPAAAVVGAAQDSIVVAGPRGAQLQNIQ